jgi:hypothetical protein
MKTPSRRLSALLNQAIQKEGADPKQDEIYAGVTGGLTDARSVLKEHANHVASMRSAKTFVSIN